MPTTEYGWDVVNDTMLMEKGGGRNTTAVYHSAPVPYGRLFSMRRFKSFRRLRVSDRQNVADLHATKRSSLKGARHSLRISGNEPRPSGSGHGG